MDAAAPKIDFEVNLPESLDRNMLGMGRSGFNGTIVTGLGEMSGNRPDVPLALKRGDATYGSGSGQASFRSRSCQFPLKSAMVLEYFGEFAFELVAER
jgi:hypothetical protein